MSHDKRTVDDLLAEAEFQDVTPGRKPTRLDTEVLRLGESLIDGPARQRTLLHQPVNEGLDEGFFTNNDLTGPVRMVPEPKKKPKDWWFTEPAAKGVLANHKKAEHLGKASGMITSDLFTSGDAPQRAVRRLVQAYAEDVLHYVPWMSTELVKSFTPAELDNLAKNLRHFIPSYKGAKPVPGTFPGKIS